LHEDAQKPNERSNKDSDRSSTKRQKREEERRHISPYSSEDEHSDLERSSKKRDKKDKKDRKDKKDKRDKKEKKHKRKHKEEDEYFVSEKEKIFEMEKARLKADMRLATTIWKTDENEHKLYFFDITGDYNNLLFARLHLNDIPFYERRKFCLGLARGEGITIRSQKGGESFYIVFRYDMRDTQQNFRYSAQKNAAALYDSSSMKR
jgi:hypothetical protein